MFTTHSVNMAALPWRRNRNETRRISDQDPSDGVWERDQSRNGEQDGALSLVDFFNIVDAVA